MKSFLQTQQWIDLKVAQGWKSHEIDGVFVLEKPLPMGLSFLYAPEINYENTKIQKIYENTKKIAEESHSIFLRLEIIDENRAEITEKLKKNGFIKAFEELQPEWRQIIDISGSEEEILNQMKPKGRYNIKISQRHNVRKLEIENSLEIENWKLKIDTFYKLYRETAKYQKISIRDKKYFEGLVEALASKDEIAIIIAEYQGQPLAGLLITFYDGLASYLYGGTSRLHKEVMAPYAAHWAAIQEAKKRGCTAYDLLAIAPEGQEKHKYSSITFFKEQFGGRKVNITGSWDLVYKPGWYKIFKAAELFRRK